MSRSGCHKNDSCLKFFLMACIGLSDAGITPLLVMIQYSLISGVVLGRQGGMVQQLFLPFFLGVGGPVGSGNQPMPWIHIKDIVGLYIHAIESEDVSGVMNGVAPQVITNKDFASSFGKALWRPSLIPLPTFAVNLLFSEERGKIMTEGQKVVPKKALDTGYMFQYPDITSAAKEFSKLIYGDEL